MDVDKRGIPANKLILGNNLQWVDRGDGLLVEGRSEFDKRILALVKDMSPTILRYPGGTLTDTYQWRDGIGALSSRKTNRDLRNRKKTIYFGTDEFLKLKKMLGAEAVLTVNVVTSSPQDAVAWLKYVNGDKAARGAHPNVLYWEIGNEPYLKEGERPDLELTPTEFARRVNAAIRALKTEDPRILVGVPLRSDRIGALAATPLQGYNDQVLRTLDVKIDFVALHNAYLPYANQNPGSDAEMYWAAMAAAKVIEDDFAFTRQQLARYLPGQDVKLAVTEYNAMFTLNKGKSDAYLASLAGAVYVADAIRVFANTPDLMFANFWSLVGNWHFGAIDQSGAPRPVFYVLKGYRDVLVGNLLSAKVRAPGFDNKTVGAVPAQQNVPLISTLATRDDAGIHLAVINKSLNQAANVSIILDGGFRAKRLGRSALVGDSPLTGLQKRPKVRWMEGVLDISGDRAGLVMPPHSVAFLHFHG